MATGMTVPSHTFCCCLLLPLQGNFTFTAEMIVALIEFITAVWLSLYMGWAIHSLRLIPRFTNTLLACCGRKYEDVYYETEEDPAAGKADVEAGQVRMLCNNSVTVLEQAQIHPCCASMNVPENLRM